MRKTVVRSVCAAALLLGVGVATSDLGAAPSGARTDGTLASQIGKPIKPFARLHATATVRTLDQILAFQAAHPMLGLQRATHSPGIPMGLAAYRTAKDMAAKSPRGAKPTLAGTRALPPVATRILKAAGPSQSDAGNGVYPPDINGAIGATQIVAAVNSTWNVYSRKGKALLNISFNSLLGTSEVLAGPRVLYDPIWKRWVFSIASVSTPSDGGTFWICISSTSDARGPFFAYHVGLPFAAGDFWDYDMLGMTQDAVLITGNHFSANGTYYGALVAAMPKAAIYNAAGWSSPLAGTPVASGTLTPPIVQDSNAHAYFIAADTSGTALDLYVGTNLSNQSQFSFSLQAQISTAFGVPPNAQQPGTTQVLDTLDGRFQSPSAQYGSTLWNVHTSSLSGFPSPLFYQLDTSGNTIVQDGYFYESLTSDDFNPSIAANASGTAFVTWNATDATGSTTMHQADVLYAGRVAADSTGAMEAAGLLVGSKKALTRNLVFGTLQRWGAYSSVFLDPTDSCQASVFNERIVDKKTWGTEFGIVGLC